MFGPLPDRGELILAPPGPIAAGWIATAPRGEPLCKALESLACPLVRVGDELRLERSAEELCGAAIGGKAGHRMERHGRPELRMAERGEPRPGSFAMRQPSLHATRGKDFVHVMEERGRLDEPAIDRMASGRGERQPRGDLRDGANVPSEPRRRVEA